MAEDPRGRAPRYRRRVVTIGAIVALAAFVIGAPWFNNRIERDLEQRVPDELAAAGFDGVSASFSGQDGTLQCETPLADPESAVDVAYDVWGVRKIDIDRGCRVRTAPTVSTLPSDSDTTEDSSAGDEAPVTTTGTADFASIGDIVAGSPELSLLGALFQESNLADRLGVAGDITLFAPSDDAFDALPADVLADLRTDSDLLTEFIGHHVVDERLDAADLVSGPLTMLDGNTVEVDVSGTDIMLDEATVVAADMVAANGVVHVVDRLLVPSGLVLDAEPETAAVQAAFDDGAIVLTGVVATEVERAELVTAATAAVGADAVDDRLTVDPDTGLDATTATALAQLVEAMPAQLVGGVSGFDGVDLFVTGSYATPAQRDSITELATSLMAEVDLEPRPEATEEQAADLETDLNEFATANPILFEPGSTVLSESADEVIDTIAARLLQFDGVSVTVEGHTDSDGTASANLTLSQGRADAVVAALVERGVDPEIITAEGFGSEQPVLVGGVEDKEASRRVEFRVVTDE